MSLMTRLSRRWDRRREAGLEPAPGVADPASAFAVAHGLKQLSDEVNAHVQAGNTELALLLLRKALGDQTMPPRFRGEVAGWLGWALLLRFPDDPVPQEARHALAVADAFSPAGPNTPRLKAFILVHDGAPAAALECAAAAASSLRSDDPVRTAGWLCIQAAAHHDLGHDIEASRFRELAISLWPECDLLPWLEQRTTA